MNGLPVIPPGKAKRGPKHSLSPEREKEFIREYLVPTANRTQVSRQYGFTTSGGLSAAKRILRENPHFLKLSGASEETPYATNHEGQPHNQSDYTSPDAEGISGLQQAA